MTVRQDHTRSVYHWVKASPHLKFELADYESAYEVMLKIIKDTEIRAGDTFLTSGYPCVCLSESPEYFMLEDKSKYQPFGFKFRKRTIFVEGGRPVIYSTKDEKWQIDEGMHWRFMHFDPFFRSDTAINGVDFTWEREWRVPKPELSVSIATGFMVPSHYYYERLSEDLNTWSQGVINPLTGYTYHDLEEYVEDVINKIIILEQ
ncbi:hypothetical protein VRB37_16395 [Erwinia billingiae]|uniref:hypothetical protein n=1 Tax=Erwinia billingiae TaxID=182337 RepID=UPI0030D55DD8